jgi:aldose 1-epimerase
MTMPPTTAPGAGVSISSGALEATFLPQLGMLGSSLRHRGEDLLALPGGLDGYRAGSVTGLPLLAPWANRLGARRYEVDGIVVDLGGLDLHTDEHGLPIHGTMTARPGWELVEVSRDSFAARFDFGVHPDLLASFPFPHELRIEATVEHTTLRVDTTLVPTGDRPVPVSFGYHPYLRLPGERRENVRLRLPDRHHIELDDRQLPTGRAHVEEAEDEPVGTRTFDDLYELGDDRWLALTGGGRRLVVEVGDGYGHAQVFTPPAAETVCLEPMTAPVNALVDGACVLTMPGTSFTARFSLRVDDAR